MREFQNIPSSAIFRDVQMAIIGQLSEYLSQTNQTLDGSINIIQIQGPIILRSPRPYLPFLRRDALIISPPYNPSDIHILDKRYADLGKKLRRELILFWEFGKEYKAPTERDLELEGERRIFGNLLSKTLDKPLPEGKKHSKQVIQRWRRRIIWQMVQEDFDELINSKN